MSKRVCLVTGGAGFIGCAISGQLADRFDRVVALDNLHPQVHANRERPGALDERVQLVEGDVTSAADWRSVLADMTPDVVVHLAAETGTGQSLTEASRHADTNVTGTTRMLDAFAEHGLAPRRIVLTSSRAVYGEGAWQRESDAGIVYPGQRDRAMLERAEWDFPGLRALPFSSTTTQPSPTSVYGATKLAQEHVLRSWSLAFGVQPVILRLQNVYGPGQSLSNPYTGIVSLFCRLAREGKTIPIYEDGRIIRDFVFIDDTADAIVAAMESNTVGNEAVDIGSGEATSVMRLGELVASRYAAPAPVVNGAFRHGDVRHASCDIGKAVETLDWTPAVMLPEGLERLCKWIDGRLRN
jgi:dTDP-L-rhamnose 4-epimerase